MSSTNATDESIGHKQQHQGKFSKEKILVFIHISEFCVYSSVVATTKVIIY